MTACNATEVLSVDGVLATVCAMCDLVSTESLLATCRELQTHASDETFFRHVADLQWGREFWDAALSRPTLRVFLGMRGELQSMHRFQRCLDHHGFRPWRKEDFYVLWAYESKMVSWSTSFPHTTSTFVPPPRR